MYIERKITELPVEFFREEKKKIRCILAKETKKKKMNYDISEYIQRREREE